MVEIKEIRAMEILDSRGSPTVFTEVMLTDGTVGEASVPSGASRGKNEAFEKRDNDSARYYGKGVLSAVKGINELIFPALLGMSPFENEEADSVMIALDGAYNKSNLGGNAILSVSLAIARAAARSLGVPLYKYLGGALVKKMPIPMMTVLNGGAHAGNNVEIQEFMLVPFGAESFSEGVRICAEIYGVLKKILKTRNLSVAVGDEGGFAPNLSSDEEAIELLIKAIKECGYSPESEVKIALDAAASEWYDGKNYYLRKRGETYTSDELINYFSSLVERYPIISIEDPMAEDDLRGWQRISERLLPKKVNLVGDDLFVTNSERILEGFSKKIASSVLIKPNQIGTLTECFEAVSVSKEIGYKTIMSHRSGDTEDTFIADLAVALSCDFVKMGAPCRAERTSKYNRLMKIESEIFAASYGFS